MKTLALNATDIEKPYIMEPSAFGLKRCICGSLIISFIVLLDI